jgi:small subunit ribosomal protein S21
MDEKRPQPAWKKKEGQQQQQGSQDHRSWNNGQRRDNHDNRDGGQGLPPLQEQRAPVIGPLEVEVYNNDVGQALKVLKNKMSKDGILAELKRRRHAEKPSEAKRRKHREALKRLRKSKGKARAGGWKYKDKSKVSESRPMSDNNRVEQAVTKDDTQNDQ